MQSSEIGWAYQRPETATVTDSLLLFVRIFDLLIAGVSLQSCRRVVVVVVCDMWGEEMKRSMFSALT